MRGDSKGSFLSRGGPAMAVVGLHVLIVYGLVVSMGIVEFPQVTEPLQAVFIQDQPKAEPEPEIPLVKPQVDNTVPVEELPQVQFDEPVAPPTEVAIPASESAISAATAAGGPPQELATSSRVEPVYPPVSRRNGEEGTVRLKVLVDANGRPADVQVANTSGFARLDQAAIQAVKRWKFVAATNGSQAIQTWTQVAVTFKLTAAEKAAA